MQWHINVPLVLQGISQFYSNLQELQLFELLRNLAALSSILNKTEVRYIVETSGRTNGIKIQSLHSTGTDAKSRSCK